MMNYLSFDNLGHGAGDSSSSLTNSDSFKKKLYTHGTRPSRRLLEDIESFTPKLREGPIEKKLYTHGKRPSKSQIDSIESFTPKPREDIILNQNADTSVSSGSNVHFFNQVLTEYGSKDNYNLTKETVNTPSVPISRDATHPSKELDYKKMQNLEKALVDTGKFHIIDEQLRFYNDRYYQPISNLKEFTKLTRKLLPHNILDQVPSMNRFGDVLNYLSANPDIVWEITPDFEKQYRDFIVFDNGIFDAKTGKWKKHKAKWPVLFQVLCDFDPDDMDCPHFDQFLKDISGGDEEVIELILQIIGYIMMQNSSLKKFFLFATEPDTGKSVLGDFIASLFPFDCTFRVQLSDFNGTFTFGSIWKRTLGMGMDLAPGVLNDVAVTKLKLLTGEKMVDAREKYLPEFTTPHHCKFLFASNHPIEISTPDDAFWSRLVLVPFLYPIDPDDKNFDLPELLQAEKSAIATKCAFAAQRLVENNYQFIQPAVATQMINSWRRYEHDPVVSFISNTCTITGNSKNFISTEELHTLFENYCLEQGYSPMAQKTFTSRVKKRFNLQSSKQRYGDDKKSLNVLCGIKFKDSYFS